ncbi:MAG: SMC-Scp complex subunit ScpB [Oscillospiraceae bacterium]
MELKKLKAALEAVLFSYAEPITTAKLAEALGAEPPLVEKLLHSLREELESEERGIQLLQLEGAWQLASKSQYGEEIKTALDNRRNTPLTPAALEVLAIIAYNQPVSRSFIEQVRGVDSSSTVANLVQKGLIAEAGRLDLPGRPIAFHTTDVFLRSFGISSLNELPPLHSEEAPEDETGLYARPEGDFPFEDIQEEEMTRAVRGGAYIETEGGSAALMGEEE